MRKSSIWLAIIVFVVATSGTGLLLISMANSPQRAVQTYMDALRKGQAQSALDLLAETPEDTALLTSDVLAKATKDMAVTDVDDHGATIKFKDSKETRWELAPVKVDGKWLVHGLAKIKSAGKVQMAVNGVAAPLSTWTVFPGRYAVEPANKILATPKMIVEAQAATETPFEPEITLADQSQQQLRAAATDALAKCAAMKSLAPAGCPWAFTAPSNAVVDETSITVTTPNAAAEVEKMTFDMGTDGRLTAPLTLKVEIAGKAAMASGAGTTDFTDSGVVAATCIADASTGTVVVAWAPQ